MSPLLRRGCTQNKLQDPLISFTRAQPHGKTPVISACPRERTAPSSKRRGVFAPIISKYQCAIKTRARKECRNALALPILSQPSLLRVCATSSTTNNSWAEGSEDTRQPSVRGTHQIHAPIRNQQSRASPSKRNVSK